MKRLLIVYPRFNEEINCTQIIEDEKGLVCYTDQKPLWAKKERKRKEPEPYNVGKYGGLSK